MSSKSDPFPRPDEVHSASSNHTVTIPMRKSPRKHRNQQVEPFNAPDPVFSCPIERTSKKRKTTIVPKNERNSKIRVKQERKYEDGYPNDVTLATRPTPGECYHAVQALAKIHPDVIATNNQRREVFALRKTPHQLHGIKEETSQNTPITDAIISTMLSQNTTDANQHRAFAKLKKTFPGWNDIVSETDVTRIEDAIRVAGLAKIRAERMQNMLQTIQKERGEANFEYLRYYDSSDMIQKELSRFKGMGPKTISCVLLFALGIPDFPVDTHVLRITQQMKWVSKSSSREAAYEYLNERVPAEMKLDLHCLLVTHGKQCVLCAANGRPQFPPKDGKKWVCPLVEIKNGKFMASGFDIAIAGSAYSMPQNGSLNELKCKREDDAGALLKRDQSQLATSSIKIETAPPVLVKSEQGA